MPTFPDRLLRSSAGWGALAGALVGLVWVVATWPSVGGPGLPSSADDGLMALMLVLVVGTTGAGIGVLAGVVEGGMLSALVARRPDLAHRFALPLAVAVFVSVWLCVGGAFAGPLVPREVGPALTCTAVSLAVQCYRRRRVTAWSRQDDLPQ